MLISVHFYFFLVDKVDATGRKLDANGENAMKTTLTKQCPSCEATKPLRSFRRKFKWAHRIYPDCNACFKVWLLDDLLGRRIARALAHGLLSEMEARVLSERVAAEHAKKLVKANKQRARKVARHHILKKLSPKELERRRKISASLLLRNKQQMGGC